jgi:hypothetical protein
MSTSNFLYSIPELTIFNSFTGNYETLPKSDKLWNIKPVFTTPYTLTSLRTIYFSQLLCNIMENLKYKCCSLTIPVINNWLKSLLHYENNNNQLDDTSDTLYIVGKDKIDSIDITKYSSATSKLIVVESLNLYHYEGMPVVNIMLSLQENTLLKFPNIVKLLLMSSTMVAHYTQAYNAYIDGVTNFFDNCVNLDNITDNDAVYNILADLHVEEVDPNIVYTLSSSLDNLHSITDMGSFLDHTIRYTYKYKLHDLYDTLVKRAEEICPYYKVVDNTLNPIGVEKSSYPPLVEWPIPFPIPFPKHFML